ncbi:MAG: hypothetical protein M1814_003647 [Vezdaea aestivalis]|nr:MAG: hypothetical protein M1814_003647 [Vezdaea aestivalis]
MHFSTIVTSLTAAAALASAQSTTTPVTGKLGDAKIVTNNPPSTVYTANLPNKNTTNVRGTIVASSASNGTGVVFTISVRGFPTSGGPFLYHLHDQPVDASGNCSSTLAHLDPYIRGEQPPCDPTQPQRCQTGDWSGKFGKISSDPFQATHTDLYSSLVPGVGAFFGNRSIVIHYANTTRITCANFVLSNSTSGTLPSGTTARPVPTGTGSAPVVTYTGAAISKVAPLGAVVLAAAALVL